MAAKNSIIGRLLMCPECGHIHYGVSRKYIKKWVKDIREHFLSLPDAEIKKYYGNIPSPPDDSVYLNCYRCGYDDLDRFLTPSSAPAGVTVHPLLDPEL